MNCTLTGGILGLALAVLLGGCSSDSDPTEKSGTNGANAAELPVRLQMTDHLQMPFSENEAILITLSDSGIAAADSGLIIDGTTVTVKEGGSYILTGTLSDGSVIIDCGPSQEVSILLRDAHITCGTDAALRVVSADALRLYTDAGTRNTIASDCDFSLNTASNVDAALFSKEDLYLYGDGSLTVASAFGHGIVSKDDLTVISGAYDIQAASHGISGKDSVTVLDGAFVIDCGKDGIHSENKDDESLGSLYLVNGTYDVTSVGDGLSAAAMLQIDGGSYTLTTGGGAAYGKQHTEEVFGGDRRGQMSDRQNASGDEAEQNADASSVDSAKGIKAQTSLYITGGSFTIDAADDALHSNGDLVIADGTYLLSTGDDGLHADSALTLLDGEITVSQSYEGLEGTQITLKDGHVTVNAADDGINAAGGADGSGFFGFGGGRDMFSSDGISSVIISGGYLYLRADGDGLDSNGDLTISGGEIYVDGPTNGANGAIDCAGKAMITGGTLVAVGSSQMAEGFDASSTQCMALVTLAQTQNAAALTLYRADGGVLLTHAPQKSYNAVYVSCPEMEVGQTYTLVTGTLETAIVMDSVVVGSSGFGMDGFGGGKGGRGDRGDMGQNPGFYGDRGEIPGMETDENGDPMVPEMPQGGFGGMPDGERPEGMTSPMIPGGMMPGGQMPPNGQSPPDGFDGTMPEN